MTSKRHSARANVTSKRAAKSSGAARPAAVRSEKSSAQESARAILRKYRETFEILAKK